MTMAWYCREEETKGNSAWRLIQYVNVRLSAFWYWTAESTTANDGGELRV